MNKDTYIEQLEKENMELVKQLDMMTTDKIALTMLCTKMKEENKENKSKVKNADKRISKQEQEIIDLNKFIAEQEIIFKSINKHTKRLSELVCGGLNYDKDKLICDEECVEEECEGYDYEDYDYEDYKRSDISF